MKKRFISSTSVGESSVMEARSMNLKEKIRLNLNSALREKKEGEEGKPSSSPSRAERGGRRGEASSPIADARELEVLVLRQLLAAVLNKEKEKRFKTKEEKDVQLTDEEIIDVISFEAKKRRESITGFERGKRQDLVEKEKKELEILEKYLPEQLPEEEIRKLVKEAIGKTGAREIKDMGKVMQELMPKIKGRTDGGLVSKIVKELLGI